MRARWIVVATSLGSFVPVFGGAVAGQQGPCAASPGELARAVTAARAPTLPAAQLRVFAAAVAALRRGDTGEAGRQLGALVRSNPALARGGGLCALIHAAVRQGTLERDSRARAGMDALALAAGRAFADSSQQARYQLQKASQDYQQAVSAIAAIQKSIYDDAMKIIGNLRS